MNQRADEGEFDSRTGTSGLDEMGGETMEERASDVTIRTGGPDEAPAVFECRSPCDCGAVTMPDDVDRVEVPVPDTELDAAGRECFRIHAVGKCVFRILNCDTMGGELDLHITSRPRIEVGSKVWVPGLVKEIMTQEAGLPSMAKVEMPFEVVTAHMSVLRRR